MGVISTSASINYAFFVLFGMLFSTLGFRNNFRLSNPSLKNFLLWALQELREPTARLASIGHEKVIQLLGRRKTNPYLSFRLRALSSNG